MTKGQLFAMGMGLGGILGAGGAWMVRSSMAAEEVRLAV